jgi:hypothetical protein
MKPTPPPEMEHALPGPVPAEDIPEAASSADRSRTWRLAADVAFVVLLIAVVLPAGWLAARHDTYWDWTSGARNSLSAESEAVLGRLEEPLAITVYAPPEHRVARAIEQLLARYRKHRPDLAVEYVDPQRFPERARDADVQLLGQMVLAYRGRRETLSTLSESSLTNAIARLLQPRAPWVAVLEGHGERAITGAAGPDLGRFAQLLNQRGFRLQPLDLARTPAIPENTDLLLISTPAIALFPGEADALVDYLAKGGNLLWLMDPGEPLGLEPLSEALGVRALPGQLVDAAASDLNLDSPTFAIVDDWPAHVLTQGLDRAAIFPGSLAFADSAAAGWQIESRLRTGALSWNETGSVRGEVTRDQGAGEEPGPLPLALVLSRPRPNPDTGAEPREQRVIVVGDGDFLSNAHLGDGSNQAIGLRMARWLTGQEDLVAVPPPPRDTDAVTLAPVRGWAIVGGALIALPLLLAGIGIALPWYRGRA